MAIQVMYTHSDSSCLMILGALGVVSLSVASAEVSPVVRTSPAQVSAVGRMSALFMGRVWKFMSF